MVQIREDIFPKIQSIFSTREEIIKIWVREAYNGLNSIFPNKKSFVEYINKIHDPLNAELLIRSAQYYLVSKKYYYVELANVIHKNTKEY